MAFIILALLSSTRIAKATRKKFLAILSEFKISLKFCRPNTKDWLAEFPLAGIQRTWNYSSQSKSVFNILKSSHSPPNTSRLIPTHPDGWDAFGLELVGLQPHPTCWSRPHSSACRNHDWQPMCTDWALWNVWNGITMENISQTIWTKHGVIQIWSGGFRSSLVDLLKTLPYICDCQIRPGISQSVKCLVRLVCLVCLVESASLMLASRSSQLNLRRTSLESDPGYLSEESRCGLLPSNVDTRLKNKWQDSPQGRHGYQVPHVLSQRLHQHRLHKAWSQRCAHLHKFLALANMARLVQVCHPYNLWIRWPMQNL